ncbi:hypothetical protein [Helicobacter sp. T3_23-1056]
MRILTNPHGNDGNVNSHNGRIFPSIVDSHTSYSLSIAEGARGWVSCHAERSEVSQNTQINRDIWRSRAQYDKETSVIADNDSTFVIADKDSASSIADKGYASVIASERSERGNLYPQSAKHAFYKPNKVDCHALDSAKMQNLIARNDGNANLPQ